MKRIIKKKRTGLFWLALFVFALLIVQGCQDTDPQTKETKLEKCKLLLDQSAWNEAITACNSVGTDEGYHLGAQAYMGRAGLSLFSILADLSQPGADTTAALFNFIPDTTNDALDYSAALDNLMVKITAKTPTIYLESLLLSSLLVFKELKNLLGLKIVTSGFETCAGNPANVENCAFAPYITTRTFVVGPKSFDLPYQFVFKGLGANFYNGLCGNSSSSIDRQSIIEVTTDTQDPTADIDPITGVRPNFLVTVVYDMTIFDCTVQNNSPLYYNKLANENFSGFSGLGGLGVLNFYSKMDTGKNYSVDITNVGTISFCNKGIIDIPATSDGKLNDCEVLGFLMNPGF